MKRLQVQSREPASPAAATGGSGVRVLRWRERLAAGLLLVVVLFGMNLHLVAWQAFGWAGMILDNREGTESWTEAALTALNAEKPCDVCRSVEVAMTATEEAGPAAAARGDVPVFPLLLVSFAERTPAVSPPPVSFALFESRKAGFPNWDTVPPSPPPRARGV